jgi:hypothetical protein
MDTETLSYYRKYRKQGQSANHALHDAKTITAFRAQEYDEITREGKVKLEVEPEQELQEWVEQ